MPLIQEKLSILVMRDNGDTRRYRLKRSTFRKIMFFLLLCPILMSLGIWASVHLWMQNKELTENLDILSQKYDKTQATASRLQNLEALLKRDIPVKNSITAQAPEQTKIATEDAKETSPTKAEGKSSNDTAKSHVNTQEESKDLKKDSAKDAKVEEKTDATKDQEKQKTDIKQEDNAAAKETSQEAEKKQGIATIDAPTAQKVLTAVIAAATNDEAVPPPVLAADAGTQAPKNSSNEEDLDGPGHVDFPITNTNQVDVSKVSNRLMAKNTIRTSLDLKNLGESSISGDISVLLSLATGSTLPLTFSNKEMGDFKILRWKKAVLTAKAPENNDLTNAQIIVQVKDKEGKLMYRNIYPLEQ